MDDRSVVMGHIPKAQLIQNMVETGLSAQDIMAGVVLSHGEYLALFDVARASTKGVFGMTHCCPWCAKPLLTSLTTCACGWSIFKTAPKETSE